MKQQFIKSICFTFSILFFWAGKAYCQNHEQYQVIDSKAITLRVLDNIPESDPREKPGIIKFFEDFGYWFEDLSYVETNTIYAGWEHLNDFKGVNFNGVLLGGSFKNFMFDASWSRGKQFDNDAANVELATKNISQYSFIFTPQLYLTYFSVGCGFGFIDELTMTSTISTSQHQHISTQTEHVVIKNKPYFALCPTVHGFIPIAWEKNHSFFSSRTTPTVSLLLSAGYDIVPKNNNLNKWSFAVGLSWHIDY